MEKRDADSMAEMPEAHPENRTRNVRTYGSSASSSTAREGNSYLTASQSAASRRIMEAVVERENMARAYRRVVANGGAPGVDKMPVDELLAHLTTHWARIKEEMRTGRYQPQPVRIVEIPKPSGGMRMLGIPTCVDRLIQQALQQVLTPIFDPGFSESSYGFRPKRSAHQAVLAAQAHVASGRRWIVDMDLEKFFDRVNHDVLMARVARKVEDSGRAGDGIAHAVPREETPPEGKSEEERSRAPVAEEVLRLLNDDAQGTATESSPGIRAPSEAEPEGPLPARTRDERRPPYRRNDPEAERLDSLLQVGGGQRYLRGAGRLDPAQIAHGDLATVEAASHTS